MFNSKITAMRYLCALVGVVALAAGCTDPAAEEASIVALLQAQQADWNAGDIEAFMEGYVVSDTLRFVGASGEVLGWNNTLERYHRNYPNRAAMGTLAFDLRDIDLLGDSHAMVFGAYSLERESDNPTGLFTLILVKANGQWRIVHDHTTADQL